MVVQQQERNPLLEADVPPKNVRTRFLRQVDSTMKRNSFMDKMAPGRLQRLSKSSCTEEMKKEMDDEFWGFQPNLPPVQQRPNPATMPEQDLSGKWVHIKSYSVTGEAVYNDTSTFEQHFMKFLHPKPENLIESSPGVTERYSNALNLIPGNHGCSTEEVGSSLTADSSPFHEGEKMETDGLKDGHGDEVTHQMASSGRRQIRTPHDSIESRSLASTNNTARCVMKTDSSAVPEMGKTMMHGKDGSEEFVAQEPIKVQPGWAFSVGDILKSVKQFIFGSVKLQPKD